MIEDTVDYRGGDDDEDSFEDDELMSRISTPPEFPPATREQVEQTWSAIIEHIAEAESPDSAVPARPPGSRLTGWLEGLFPVAPAWTWQMARVAALVVLGFGAAWIAARQGWLPGADNAGPTTVSTEVDKAPDRTWLAGGDYGSRLEALLLGVSKGDSSTIAGVAPAAREVSRELLNDNRLYQRLAERKGDPALSELLSRMEIILLALATAPDGQEEEVIEALRQFIDESDVLSDLREVRSTVPRVPRPRAVTTGS